MAINAAERTSGAVQLDPGQVAEIADRLTDVIVERVVEAIRAEAGISHGHAAMPWLDAKEVAELLGVERDWVYQHANELGASRIGGGARPLLRFPPDVLDSKSKARSKANSQRAKRQSKPTGLLPIHGE